MKSRVKCLLFIILVFVIGACSPKLSSNWLVDTSIITNLEEHPDYKRPCADPLNYVPDEFSTEKILRVNFHLIDSPEKNANFSLEEGRKYMKELLKNANSRLGLNKQMNLPIGNNTPVIDPGVRYKLVGLDEEDDGIYYHIDSVDYYFLNKGKLKNNYDRRVVNKYATRDDSILNIFVISQPVDSIKSSTYRPVRTGIALGTSLKISGIFSKKHKKPWYFGALLNHEIGHVLGLAHSWNRFDGCDDTPEHPNCWDENTPKCKGSFSNNVMDYNKSQIAYTPCQIGKIHKTLRSENSKIRKLIYEDWCDLDSSNIIVIDSEVEWMGDRDVRHNIHITSTGRLDLHCRLSMPAGSQISIDDGGELHIHKFSKIHNACGKTWKGIEHLTTKKNSLLPVFKYGNPKINHIEGQMTQQNVEPKFGGSLPKR